MSRPDQRMSLQSGRETTAAFPPLLLPGYLFGPELEGVEQVVQRRTVGRHIRVRSHNRIREVVTSGWANGWQAPVALDEFDDGNVIGIAVVDHATGGIRRNDQQRNPRAIAEEVNRLDVPGIIVAAAFIEGDEDGRARP